MMVVASASSSEVSSVCREVRVAEAALYRRKIDAGTIGDAECQRRSQRNHQIKHYQDQYNLTQTKAASYLASRAALLLGPGIDIRYRAR